LKLTVARQPNCRGLGAKNPGKWVSGHGFKRKRVHKFKWKRSLVASEWIPAFAGVTRGLSGPPVTPEKAGVQETTSFFNELLKLDIQAFQKPVQILASEEIDLNMTGPVFLPNEMNFCPQPFLKSFLQGDEIRIPLGG